ncbi:hypothetical protein CK489_29110 [Bradyrhizobium sp. UFLA03-84]|uniref:hypothetical protein n=1 Tax=Bradyrhizobium sp. UFLA03-84 TaxID=418599 RepID=UPI000BAE0AE4|nr:hypothetical protein [Bradyrhizobium sp. UFLA03-84]PAY05445.1 hypothetical protein CK489_29110 [Bradyrhizobium sp. UFLA03-84]
MLKTIRSIFIALACMLAAPAMAQTTQSYSTYVLGLPAASTLTGTEKIATIQGGASKYTTPQQILALLVGSGDCTISSSIVCTKTNGVNFSSLATTAPGTGVVTALGNNTNAAGGLVTSPVPVANGGTGDTGTGWTTFTPSPSCGTATFTVASARSKTIGKTTFIELNMTITALGTCTNSITIALPNTAASSAVISGANLRTGGFAYFNFGTGGTSATCILSAGAAYTVNDNVVYSGVYENQ